MNDMWTTSQAGTFEAPSRTRGGDLPRFSDFKEIEIVLKPSQTSAYRLFEKNHLCREQEALTGLPKSLSLSLPLRSVQFGPQRTL
jgi:hypothetical protein